MITIIFSNSVRTDWIASVRRSCPFESCEPNPSSINRIGNGAPDLEARSFDNAILRVKSIVNASHKLKV